MRAALRNAGAQLNATTAVAALEVRWALDEGYREVLFLINKFDPEIRQLLNDFPLSGRIGEKVHFLHLQVRKVFDDADGIVLE